MYTRYFPNYYSGYGRCYRPCNYVPFRNYYGYNYYNPYNNYINSNLAYTNQSLYNSGIMDDVIQQSIISQTPTEHVEVTVEESLPNNPPSGSFIIDAESAWA